MQSMPMQKKNIVFKTRLMALKKRHRGHLLKQRDPAAFTILYIHHYQTFCHFAAKCNSSNDSFVHGLFYCCSFFVPLWCPDTNKKDRYPLFLRM